MSAREDREAQVFANKLRAAGFPEMADSHIQRQLTGQAVTKADQQSSADRFAWSQVEKTLMQSNVELSRDAGHMRADRRAEAWAAHMAGREKRSSSGAARHGLDGHLTGIDAQGITDLDPLDPRNEPTWHVLHPLTPQYLHRLEPSNELTTILEKHLSIFAGYSGALLPCEYSSSVDGIGGGGCTWAHQQVEPGSCCCTGESTGWVIDPWRERRVILIWRACTGCLAWARETGPAVHDGPHMIHDPSGDHAAKIETINTDKAHNEIALSEKKLKEIWGHHPGWVRGEDGRWHPPAFGLE